MPSQCAQLRARLVHTLGLLVIAWVPGGIIYHNDICRSDVETDAARLGADQEDEYAGVLIELVDCMCVCRGGGSEQ